MNRLALALVLAFSGTAHAGLFDGFNSFWSDVPVRGEAEPADPDFDFGNWFTAGDFTLAPDEPLVVLNSTARAVAAAPAAEGPVLGLEDFVTLYLNSTPAQRSKAMGLALKPVLKGMRNKDQVRDCSVHAGEIVADRVVGDFLLSREPASAVETADAIVAGIGVCLGSSEIQGAQIIKAFAEAISAALARPQ